MSGWMILPRKFFDSAAWQEKRKFSRAEAMLYLYQRAQWDDAEVFIRGKFLKIARGEQVASIRFLAEAWRWSKDSVDRFLKTMEASGEDRARIAASNSHTIRREVRQGETVLILCNYNTWTTPEAGGKDTDVPALAPDSATPGRTLGSDPARRGPDKAEQGNERNKGTNDEREADDLTAHAQTIVGSYPRREKLADALGIVLAQLREGADPVAMLAGTRAAARVIEAAPSGALNKYVPSAVNFFRARRWEDDPATLIRPPGGRNGGVEPMTDAELAEQLGGRTFDY